MNTTEKTLLALACIAAAASCNKVGPDKVIGTSGDEAVLEDIEFQNASASFYGEYVEGLSNYYITLYNGSLDADGNIAGDAEVLVIDLYADKSGTASSLPTGSFTAASADKLSAGTFCEGRELSIIEALQPYIDGGLITLADIIDEYGSSHLNDPSGEFAGSEFYIQTLAGKDEDGDDSYDYVDFPVKADSGSEVSISKSGTNYTIKVLAKFDTKDVTYTYTGPVEIADESEEEGGGESPVDPGDRDSYEKYTTSFTQGEADYAGTEDGYYFWYVYLGDSTINLEDLSGNGDVLCVELATTVSGNGSLPAGDYIINAESGNYIAVGYYEYEENGKTYSAGTNFYRGDELLLGSTDGNIKVSRNGTTYTIEVNLYDDDYGVQLGTTYSGNMKVLDLTTSSASTKALCRSTPKAKVFTPIKTTPKARKALLK